MKNKRINLILLIVLLIWLVIIILNMCIHVIKTKEFNETPRKYLSSYNTDNGADTYVSFGPRGGKTDSWIKRAVFLDGSPCDAIGTTYDAVVFNKADCMVRDWTLTITINQHCFINNSWNGEVEIHQNVLTDEKIQRIDFSNYNLADMLLDYQFIGQDIMIPLFEGDYIVYHPNEAIGENIVNAFNGNPGEMTIGIIFYSLEEITFKNYAIDYHYGKKYLQGREAIIFIVMMSLWFCSVLIYTTVNISVLVAKKRAEHSLIRIHLLETEALNKQISEQQKSLEIALESAEHANRIKSDFLANMSHEIRTPINAIIGMNTMIMRESNQEKIRKYSQDVKTASSTLLSLINDILDFSKIESGMMEIIEGNYRLDSAINDLINMVKPKAYDKGLDFELELNPHTPVMLHGDEVRVKQVALNILNNAVKYTKQGFVKFIVDFEKNNDESIDLKIAVKDSGIGIKPEDMEKLCSPYARLEEGRNSKVEGTGLGLSITKNLLEKMGSKIQVNSVYGEGSEFYFIIKQGLWGQGEIGEHFKPLSNSDEDNDAPENYHAPDAKILVVDDIEMNLMVIKNLLKRVQINPILSTSGMEAVDLCTKEKFDIIFMDAMMPGMSGEETLKEIRKSCELNCDTPIIILTANAIVGAKDEYLACGFSDYISKPVDGIKLENMIQNYLPKELLIEPDTTPAISEEVSSETEEIIYLVSMVNGIDVKSGISAAGGKTTYVNVCENFCTTGDEKIRIIEDYLNNEDYANYTIQVHALKSSARLIGANGLSEEALRLETAGKEENVVLIKRNTGAMLDEYRGIVKIFKKILQKELSPDQDTRPEITWKKLSRKLEDMVELLQAYDFASAKELFQEFKKYKLPEEFKETYGKMQIMFGNVDTEGLINLISTRIS